MQRVINLINASVVINHFLVHHVWLNQHNPNRSFSPSQASYRVATAEGRGNTWLKFTDFVKTGAGLDGGLVLPNSARDLNVICWLWGVDTSLALAFTKGSFSIGEASKLWLFVFTPRTQSFSLDGKSHLLKYFSVIGKTFWHTFRRL